MATLKIGKKKPREAMTRSEIMRRVQRKNTPQEMIVRRLLYSMGYRYRIHVKGLPGTPDIAFRSSRKAIFVHGCFWHRHNCYLATTPKTSQEFWLPKFQKNVERDRRKEKELTDLGWQVMTIWQCELENHDKLRRHLKAFMRKPSPKK
jgi:DNA mismatch endonuclease (patch repair protein)